MLAVDEGWHLLMSLGEFDLVLSFFSPITIIAIIGLEIFVDFSINNIPAMAANMNRRTESKNHEGPKQEDGVSEGSKVWHPAKHMIAVGDIQDVPYVVQGHIRWILQAEWAGWEEYPRIFRDIRV